MGLQGLDFKGIFRTKKIRRVVNLIIMDSKLSLNMKLDEKNKVIIESKSKLWFLDV